MSTQPTVRVLIVDDSAFARKVLNEVLSRDASLTVVGIARDGLEALEKVVELQPDVITLDLIMPNLDGLGVLRGLRDLKTKARAIVVSMSDEDSDLVAEAFELGALDVVKKPTALATSRLYELSGELLQKVHLAATARQVAPSDAHLPIPLLPVTSSSLELVVVGTSTGGPQALTELLSGLPANFPVPLALALHIPGEYTEAVAKRLNNVSQLTVVEAMDRMPLQPGVAILAKGGRHLLVERGSGGLAVRVRAEPRSASYFPSVDVLFRSAAETCGGRVLGVVLTGMGADGLEGSRAIVQAGGKVITESERSSVIFGMPRVVLEAGLSSGEAELSQMAKELIQRAS